MRGRDPESIGASMVPADDEHTSTNEPEDNTSTRGTFFEKLKFWKRDKKDANEPARLKTLPKSLMHWTTPVWIAAAGFLFALAWAVNWRGTFHWPSADAMKLCATIAGAGFAFSAWQQRSHDNAVREQDKLRQEQAESRAREDREKQRNLDETRRHEQIERDEYWKRREHIYQLLGSKNPVLRLSAVALLVELADTAAQSKLLSATEKQQLQQHIIATLCTQMRHEGLAHETEGSLEEHASIQEEILNQLAKRIHEPRTHSSLANWRAYNIDLSHTTFYTPVILHSLHIAQSIDVRNSIFHSRVTITDSTLNSLHWAHAAFRSQLNISDCTVIHDRFPDCLKEATFSHVIFKLAELTETEHQLQLSEHKKTRTETNIITFDNECHLHGSLKLITREGYGDYSSEIITIANSTLDAIEITSEQGHTNNFHAILTISGCKILESLHIHNINYWFPAAEAHTESELAQMSVQDIEDLQNEIFYTMHSSPFGNDPAYTDATYTQQSAIYLISNSFSDTTLEHHPQFEGVNGYEDGEGCQSKKFITFRDNATLDKKPLRLSQWLNEEGVSEEHGDNRCIELSSRGNIEDRNMS
mgnify:FL=1